MRSPTFNRIAGSSLCFQATAPPGDATGACGIPLRPPLSSSSSPFSISRNVRVRSRGGPLAALASAPPLPFPPPRATMLLNGPGDREGEREGDAEREPLASGLSDGGGARAGRGVSRRWARGAAVSRSGEDSACAPACVRVVRDAATSRAAVGVLRHVLPKA